MGKQVVFVVQRHDGRGGWEDWGQPMTEEKALANWPDIRERNSTNILAHGALRLVKRTISDRVVKEKKAAVALPALPRRDSGEGLIGFSAALEGMET